MLKLKLQYFVYLMQRTNSLEKILLVGKDPNLGEKVEGKKEKRAAEDEMVI